MHRSSLARLSLVLVLLLAAAPHCFGDVPPAAAPGAIDHNSIFELIDHLIDSDPPARNDAINRLVAMGDEARPSLMTAMETANPELRTAISQLLMRGPWLDAGDSEPVKQIMSTYAQSNVESRCQQIARLSELAIDDTAGALLRILKNDPSSAARWTAGQIIRIENPGKPIQDKLRALTAHPNVNLTNAPLLATSGWAWREVDVQRTRNLLSNAVEIEAKRPAAINGQLDFAYLWLIQYHTDHHQYPDALRLLRQQAARTTWDDSIVPGPVANLIAFQAEHGPFTGYLDDLHTYRSYLNHAELIYSLGRLMDRQSHPLPALVLDAASLISNGFSAEDHCQTAGFLIEQGWNTLAQVELRIALVFAGDMDAVNVYFQRARLAGQMGDEYAIAVNLESALNRISDQKLRQTTRFGDVLPWSDADAWAEVHWHYLRDAEARHDMTAVQTHLEKLMELDRLNRVLLKDPGLATDIVPALNETGHPDDAIKCFDAAYKNLAAAVTADPADVEAKNNLAWLCARCNQRLEEAATLADQAVAAAPDTAAYLDTAAEAQFRLGHRDRAIDLECKALQLKPADSFMSEQLKRFQTPPRP